MMADCFLLLLTGDIITGITCTWTNVIGVWFYAIMMAAFQVSVAIRYGNILGPSIMGSILSILMIGLLDPMVVWIPTIMLVVNIGVILYSVYVREE